VTIQVDALLETLDRKTGAAPESRIRDASHANSIYMSLFDTDQAASFDRATVDAVADGRPPYGPDEVPADCCNVNFGDASALEEKAMTAYVDLVHSVPYIASCKTKYGSTEEERYRLGQILSEEFSKFFRNWPGFDPFYQTLCKFFIRHGVSFAYFPSDVDWRPKWTTLQYFKCPRGATTDVSTIEIATISEDIAPHKLWAYIKDPEIAKMRGWNVKATRDAILNFSEPDFNFRNDWEEFERQVKSNDLWLTYSRNTVIKCVHYFVQEFDGTVSHYIGLQGLPGNDTNEFLYEQRHRFDSMLNTFVPFTFGTGNGDLHSIRGLGFKSFNLIQVMNRLQCQEVDAAQLSSTIFITPATEDNVNDIGLLRIQQGVTVLPSGYTINQQPMINVGNNVLPIIQQLDNKLNSNTGQYRTESVPTDTKERTRREVEIVAAEKAVLTTSSMNLFYTPWGQLLWQVMRRVQNKDYQQNDPGGKEVFEFRKCLLRRGVPLEALYDVYEVTPVRAIGYGSAGNRINVLGNVLSLQGAMDEVGRYTANRNALAAQVGWDQVDMYLPPMAMTPRQPIDTKIAMLEEGEFKTGTMVPVTDGENDAIHLQIHMPAIQSVFAMSQQGQIPPEMAFRYFNAAIPHDATHIQKLSLDPTRQMEVKAYSDMLNQIAQVATQMGQQLSEQLQAQQEAAAQAGQVDVEDQVKIQKAKVDNDLKIAKANVDASIKLQKAQQQMAIKDTQAAQKFRQKAVSERQDVRQGAIETASEVLVP
jgi:hypothetical protein